MATAARSGPADLDALTIGAIAVIAWALAAMLHEGAGHGGTAVLLGARAQALTSCYFSYAPSSVSAGAARLIAAGGSVATAIVGLPIALALPRLRVSPALRLFLWLFAAFDLLTAFGYLMFSGIGGVGDWSAVIAGLPHALAWRGAEAIAGFLLYFWVAPRLLWPGLAPLAGAAADRERRARTLTLLPYLAAGGAAVAAGLRNPQGIRLVLISSVAASFGGASLLAWYFPLRARRSSEGAPASLGIARSRAWIVAAAVALAIFVGLFGRGLSF